MTEILRKLEITFEDDGTVRAGRGHYVRVNEVGADVSVGTKYEPAALTLLPDEVSASAELVAKIDDLSTVTQQVEALQSEKSELEETVATLQDGKDALQADLTAAQGNVSDLEATVSAKDAQIADLASQIEELTRPAATSVHVAWFRAALADLDLLDAVNIAVAQQPVVKQELWEYATAIDITRPDIIAIAEALEIDLDAVLARAGEIRDADAA